MQKKMIVLSTGMIAGAILASTACVTGQQDNGAQLTPEQQAVMDEWNKLASPGEHHKQLDYFVGKWRTKTKMFMGPGADPLVSEGSSDMKWVLNGRFIMDAHEGTMMGKPYSGIGMTGYDNFRNMYVSSWCSNQGTNMLTMTGTRNPKTGVFTYYGEMDEPALKMVGRTVKYVAKIVDHDHYAFEIYDLAVGDDYKVVEIQYERIR